MKIKKIKDTYGPIIDGELQFYKAINQKVQKSGGDAVYGKKDMKIFENKIRHSLETLGNLKNDSISLDEFSKTDLKSFLNYRNIILLQNDFDKNWLPDLSRNEILTTQSKLALSELAYLQHFIEDATTSEEESFSPELKNTKYGKRIIQGFNNKDSFVDAIKKIKNNQIEDKTAYIAQAIDTGMLGPKLKEEEIEYHTYLFETIFRLKKYLVEPPLNKEREIMDFLQYLDEFILPRY